MINNGQDLPLFKTNDGVNIARNQDYWYIYTDDTLKDVLELWSPKLHYMSLSDYGLLPLGDIQFSTKEKAIDYINSFKPKNEFDFEDLSYSGIVSLIDTDLELGKKFIIEAFNRIKISEVTIENLDKKLNIEASHLKSLYNSIDLVMKHLELNKPLAITVNKDEKSEIIMVTESGVSIEKNVI